MSKFLPIADISWLPLVVFSVIIAFSALVGFYANWKRSLYFLTGNAVFFIVGIYVYEPICDLIQAKLLDGLLNDTPYNLTAVIQEIRKYIGAIFLFGWLLAANIILGFIFIFISKKLVVYKYVNVQNKNGESKITRKKQRFTFSGTALAGFTGFLIAVPAMDTTQTFFTKADPDVQNNNFNNKLLKRMSLNQIYDSQNIFRILKLIELVNDKNSAIYSLTYLFANDKNSPDNNNHPFHPEIDIDETVRTWNDGKSDLQLAFGDANLTAALVQVAPELILSNSPSLPHEFIDIVKTSLTSIIPYFKPLNLNEEVVGIFNKLFSRVFIVQDGNGKVIQDETNQVVHYLSNHLFGDGTYNFE